MAHTSEARACRGGSPKYPRQDNLLLDELGVIGFRGVVEIMGGGLVGSGVWCFLAGSLAGPLPSCNSEAAPMLEATELR